MAILSNNQSKFNRKMKFPFQENFENKCKKAHF